MTERTEINFYTTYKKFHDIYPILFGYECCKSGHKFGPFIRNYYLIHYISSGKGTFENSVGKYYLKKGDIFIILPNEVTTYKADLDEPWEYTWIAFDGEIAKRFDVLTERAFPYNNNTFMSMRYCMNLGTMREEYLISKIYELISVIFDEGSIKADYVSQATEYIKACFMMNISAESVSDMVGLNRTYLSRLLKKEYGVSLQKFIIDIRLENAKKMINMGYNISESAQMSGFSDAFNFSKTFKKHIGISPMEYKIKQSGK